MSENWINTPTDERFTALHFATYHGNMELIRLMVEEMAADIRIKNAYGANVLHVAAQGDQPCPLYYFTMRKDMDINEQDNRGSTPLHWACYSKAEYALNYILAFGPNLEIQDQNGLTPLHLAVRTVPDLKSTRPVRSLLLRGSSRSAVSAKGQTVHDMISPEMTDQLRAELTGMLAEPVYLECFMRRVPLKPIRQNHKTQALFVIFFLFVLTSQYLIVLPGKSLSAVPLTVRPSLPSPKVNRFRLHRGHP